MELDPSDLCRLCLVSKYLQAVAEDEWLWKQIIRTFLVPDDALMPPAPLLRPPKPAVDPGHGSLRRYQSYELQGPFFAGSNGATSSTFPLPQHHARRFQYHQSRGPWWKSVFKRHKTFLQDSDIPVICYRSMSYPPTASCVRSVKGPIIAVAGYRDIRLVNFRTGGVTKTLRGHSKFVTGLAGGNGQNLLVSCSEDCSVRVWDTGLSTGDAFVTAQFEYSAPVRALLYSPDSRLLFFGGDDALVQICRPLLPFSVSAC